jgi:hypothetical protein
MTYRTGTHHIQIHIDQALDEMLVRFHSRGVVAILPECTFAILPLVLLLTGSSCNQLHDPTSRPPRSNTKRWM